MVLHELYFGAFNSERKRRNTDDDARFAGGIRADLKRKGTPIGPYDTLIAGQASARDLTPMTRNTREFARIEGVRVENWEGRRLHCARVP